jgi:phosphoribosyl 1,2-cyclic phosphate phosphodiesterase
VRVIFLGTGSSLGIPVLGCKCATCTSSDPRDTRNRCSLYIETSSSKILIDTGPDLKAQLLRNNITDLDAVLYTHEHNDHTAGLDDVRPICFFNNKILPAYGLSKVLNELENRFQYAFAESPYPGAPKITLHPIEPYAPFSVVDDEILPLAISHGSIDILGYKIGQLAYLTDVFSINDQTLHHLKNIEVLVISLLQVPGHHSHASYEEIINYIDLIQAKKTYLIHMSHTLGPVAKWSVSLPAGVEAAYDGLTLTL